MLWFYIFLALQILEAPTLPALPKKTTPQLTEFKVKCSRKLDLKWKRKGEKGMKGVIWSMVKTKKVTLIKLCCLQEFHLETMSRANQNVETSTVASVESSQVSLVASHSLSLYFSAIM